MLFKIDKSVNYENYHLLTEEDRMLVESSINQLASYGCSGELFLLSHNFFGKLLKYISVSKREREYLINITSKLPTLVDIDTKVNMLVELVLCENKEEISQVTINEVKVVRIDIRNPILPNVARRPKLLCEDLNDIEAYKIILDYYITLNRLIKSYDFEPLHGGGSRTADIFSNCCEEKRGACLCLYDTDIKYKDGPKSDRATKIERKKINNDYPFVDATCFEDLREIENAIPHNLIHEIKPDMSPTNRIREHLIRNCSKESWKFLDMKEGLKESKIASCECQTERLYWRKVIRNLELCREEDSYIEGYGDGLLYLFVKKIKDNPYLIRRGNYRVDEFLSEYWLSVGKYIYSWVCTYKLVR